MPAARPQRRVPAVIDAPRPLRPLTERVLARLPNARRLWIAVWALVPWANAGANLMSDAEARSAVWEQRPSLVVLNYTVLSVGVVIVLWGTARIARRLESLRATTPTLVAASTREPFREVNNVAAPLVLSVAAAVAFGASAFVQDGMTAALLRGTTWFVLGTAFWTFLWTYGALQLGLDRLGREHLRTDAASLDPGLGLRPLGGVAFMGLWMLLAWLVPLVLTGLPDVVGVTTGLLVLLAGLAAFFLSLFRLHRQMVEVKANELAVARELYAQAYEPVRAERTLDALARQHSLLGAADALEKRAHAIHEWPIDEGTLARVLTIVTSVIAMTIARLILDPLGL